MSENVQQDPLTEAASESTSSLSIKRISVKDVSELKQYKFRESVDKINEENDIGIQVREFENPHDPGDPWVFAVNQITAKVHAEIFDTVFDLDILSDALDASPEQETEIRESALQSLKQGAQETYLVKQARAIHREMLYPEQSTVESILHLPLAIQHELYEACTIVAARVWRFQPVAETAERGTGRDTAG